MTGFVPPIQMVDYDGIRYAFVSPVVAENGLLTGTSKKPDFEFAQNFDATASVRSPVKSPDVCKLLWSCGPEQISETTITTSVLGSGQVQDETVTARLILWPHCLQMQLPCVECRGHHERWEQKLFGGDVTQIPYQVNGPSLVALLPDGKVTFLHPAARPILDAANRGEPLETPLDEYFIDSPLVDLNQFHLSAPAIAFVEITNQCNLLCKHCYAWSGSKRKNELETSKICDLLDDFALMGVLQVFLTGGEVFTHPDALTIIQHARTKRFSTQIFTNGLLLREQILEAIPSGQSFFVSFDTAHPQRTVRGKMDYEKLKNCFELIIRYGHVVRTAVSVHTHNLDDVEEIFEWCASNGFPRPQWLETHPIGRALLNPEMILTPEKVEKAITIYQRCMDRFHTTPDVGKMELDVAAEKPSKGIRSVQTIKFCQALERATGQEKCGRSVAYVASDGSVYPCSNCMSNGCYKAGNVKDHSFQHIWENGFGDFRTHTFQDHTVCDSCEVFQNHIWCQFRCPPLAQNVSKTETGCGATEYLQRFMVAANRYWMERRKEGRQLALIANSKR